MPRSPRSKRPAFKRKARKQRSKGVMTNVNRGLQPIASRYICKMKYSEIVTTGASGRYIMNLNSVYDPNRTGGGHQPYGFDILATLYNRYRVIKCSYVLFTPVISTGPLIQLAVLPANEGTAFLTGSEVRENPRARFVVTNPGSPAKMLKGTTNINTLTGRTKAQYMADDRYQALTTSDPAEVAVLNVLTTDNSDLGIPIAVTVIFTYTVEFFDPKNVAQSLI